MLLHKKTFFCGVILALGLAVSGCSFQPLYGENGAVSDTKTLLKDIDVSVAGADERVAQNISNEIKYRINEDTGKTTYSLKVEYTETKSALFSNTVDRVTSNSLRLSASWTLYDSNTAEPVYKSNSFTAVSYNLTDQPYANLRALRDAQDRAAVLIAEDIVTKLAAHLAVTAR